jgi:catalase
VVPGIDFSNDPLLQGRLFSYLDTQLIRLGGPNFNEIPVNQPKCPWANLQRDGHMRMRVAKGRVNYEPNTLAPEAPRADPRRGFTGLSRPEDGSTMRIRPESFADHYNQAEMFFLSQTETEKNHLVAALVFELSKVETPAVRERVVSHLLRVDEGMAKRVAAGLRIGKAIKPAATEVPARRQIKTSPALSIIGKSPQTLKGRIIAVLASDGVDCALIEALRAAVHKEGAHLKIVAPHVGGAQTADGKMLEADMQLAGAPSIFFDAVAVIVSEAGTWELAREAGALDFVSDAFNHLKVIGYLPAAKPLLQRAGITDELMDAGVVKLGGGDAVAGFITAAKKTRVWDREPKVRNLP